MSALFTSKNRLPEGEADRIIREWNQFVAGLDRAFGLAVIDGTEGTLTKLGTDFSRDLGLHDLRRDIESRILAPLNVPPVIVGAVIGLTNTQSYASYEQARAAFYEENVDPNVKRMESLFTKGLAAEFEGVLRVRADTSNIMALEGFRKLRSDRLNAEVLSGRTTVNEARAEAGKPHIVGGDVILQPVNVTPMPVAMASDSGQTMPISRGRIRRLTKALVAGASIEGLIDEQIRASMEGSDDADFDAVQRNVRRALQLAPLHIDGATYTQDAVRLLLSAHILTKREVKWNDEN